MEDIFKEALEKLSDAHIKNLGILYEAYNSISSEIIDENGKKVYQKNILHLILSNLYDEDKAFLAIQTLINYGIPIQVKSEKGNNFIQTALNTGYSEDFILKITRFALDRGLNVNDVNNEGDTIVHTALKSENYQGDIFKLVKLLLLNGYDINSMDNKNQTIYDIISDEDESARLEQSVEAYKTCIRLEQQHEYEEIELNEIENMVEQITSNYQKNIEIIESVFTSLNYIDDFNNKNILHIIVDVKFDEDKVYKIIETLINYWSFNPNSVDLQGDNFLQIAVSSGYSQEFIVKVLELTIPKGLDVNHRNKDGATIMHNILSSYRYIDDFTKIYDLLCKNGFDSTITDNEGHSLSSLAISGDKSISSTEYAEFLKCLNSNSRKIKSIVSTDGVIRLTKPEINKIESYGIIMNTKNYNSDPAIARDKELKNLMVTLAQDRRLPIIVGESGVGKTAIVDGLIYRIKNGMVPSFLKNQIILEINPSNLVAGCELLGKFEEKLRDVFKLCHQYDMILFIDEIHTIYGTGSAKNKDTDMAAILKQEIDRANLRIIGTTTEQEYEKYFANDALKRRFEKIIVKEPTNEVLVRILNNVIDDYCLRYNLEFENYGDKKLIIDTITTNTSRNYRVYNDIVNNPDLSISIIDKAFAFARFDDAEYIKKEHFIESLSCCERIYETTRDRAIADLKDVVTQDNTRGAKILYLGPNKFNHKN